MPTFYEIRDGKVYVTTSTGVEVQCLPFWNEVMMAGSALSFPDEPEVPTYTFTDADQDSVERPYNQEAIDDPKTPDEDREKWAAYLELKEPYERDKLEVLSKQQLMRTRVLALKATKVKDLDLDAWANEHLEMYGIEIPEDDRMIYWFASEVVKVELDGAKIMAGIARASGMTEDQLDSIEEEFPDPLGGTRRSDDQPTQTQVAESEQDASSGVVDLIVVE